jgi:hypothetical protein
MSHVRTQIRDRVATLLADVATVHKSRIHRVAEGSSLPVLLVYTNAEQILADEAAFNALERSIEVVVEIVDQAASELDTALDDLLEGVEVALAADPTLNGLVNYCIPATVDVSLLAEGAQPIGRMRVTFATLTRTSYEDPSTVV